MFERLAAAAIRASGGQVFAAPAPPEMDSVWTPTKTHAGPRAVVAVMDEFVCYQRRDGVVRSVSLATWHRWRRRTRAVSTVSF